MSNKKIINLVDIIYKYLASIDDSKLFTFLANWPSSSFKFRSTSNHLLPVMSYLSEIESNENDGSLAVINCLKECAESLYWGQTYTTEDFDETFLSNYGWTEIIGLRGPVASNDIACGFLMLGPDTEYPKHSHEAEEIYIPFNSQTLWIKGNENWMPEQVGVPIYHPSRITHGMRTGPSPLLALYLWQGGNLVQKSVLE